MAPAYLHLHAPDTEERRWPLADHLLVTIGRDPAVDVCVDWDPQVSRVHAVLEQIAGRWTVVDDGLSRNGTYVDGTRIFGHRTLRDRDTIRVGNTTLVYRSPAAATGAGTLVGDALVSRSRLTDTQLAVLVALCRPYRHFRPYAAPATNQQIAEEVFLSVDAVKTHLRVLFHKFGIDDLPQNQKRARLVEMALQLGIVSGAEL